MGLCKGPGGIFGQEPPIGPLDHPKPTHPPLHTHHPLQIYSLQQFLVFSLCFALRFVYLVLQLLKVYVVFVAAVAFRTHSFHLDPMNNKFLFFGGVALPEIPRKTRGK